MKDSLKRDQSLAAHGGAPDNDLHGEDEAHAGLEQSLGVSV